MTQRVKGTSAKVTYTMFRMQLSGNNEFIVAPFTEITIRNDIYSYIEPRHEKTNNVVSQQVRHKPSFTVTSTAESLDLESTGIVLSV